MSAQGLSARSRMRSSRLGGLPTTLPPPGTRRPGQLALRIYHGVPKVLDGTALSWLDLPAGRLSITARETGLA